MEEWTMSEEDWERLHEEAADVGLEAHEATPQPNWWGIEYYGDAPAAIGGGFGAFLWFPTKEALFDFVGRLLTFANPGPSEVDHGRVAREVAASTDRIRAGQVSMDDGMVALNVILTRFSQIRWWGQFQELLTGTREFELDVRAWARSSWSEDGEESTDTSPITPDELEPFIEALLMYGV